MKLHLLILQVQRAGEPKDKLGKNWEFYFVYACLTLFYLNFRSRETFELGGLYDDILILLFA